MAAGHSSKTLLVLDFDRTLFDLKSFLQDFQKYFWEKNNASRKLTGPSKAIDIFENPQSYSWEDHCNLWLAAESMPQTDYVFDDARRLLAFLGNEVVPVIITYGFSKHNQYFKRSFAPSLHSLPFYVTNENKGLLLAKNVSRQERGIKVGLPNISGHFNKIVLIDDNPASFEPIIMSNAPICMIHLLRTHGRYRVHHFGSAVERVSALDGVSIN